MINLPALFTSMTLAQPGERDLLVAGDFNLRPTDLAMVVAQQDDKMRPLAADLR